MTRVRSWVSRIMVMVTTFGLLRNNELTSVRFPN